MRVDKELRGMITSCLEKGMSPMAIGAIIRKTLTSAYCDQEDTHQFYLDVINEANTIARNMETPRK
jgi:hypothetical protein